MRHDFAIANLHEDGVMEIVEAVCTPENDRMRSWADMQYGHYISLVGKSDHDETYINISREEDIEPTIALLAEAGVYLTPYYPYVGEGWV